MPQRIQMTRNRPWRGDRDHPGLWFDTEPAREPWHSKPRPAVRIRITFDASQFIAAMQRADAAAQRLGEAFARAAQEIAASMERER